MKISPIDINKSIISVPSVGKAEITKLADPATSFENTMKKAVGEVNNLQSDADKMAVNLVSGNLEDVHTAMIAMQKAKLALDLTIQVRNKVLEAYQEIMRMQV